MGEVVKMSGYERGGDGCSGAEGDEERIIEWEAGLPCSEDLMPLSQPLIPPELASAFSISPEPFRSVLEVNRASQKTFSAIRANHVQTFSSNNFKSFNETAPDDLMMVEEVDETDRDGSGSDNRKSRKIDFAEEDDSALRAENSSDDPSARTSKRPRLVWTPQLHRRFIDVVTHLGIKNAVPKTIMQLMNVEGLTRENVASHLQKYRLYLKRMQGFSNEGPTSSDQLFASTPMPQTLHESSSRVSGHSHGHSNGHMSVPFPMPYPHSMMPMPVLGMPPGHGHMGFPVGAHNGANGYHGFESYPKYGMMQQRDWSGSKYNSMVPYPHMAHNDK